MMNVLRIILVILLFASPALAVTDTHYVTLNGAGAKTGDSLATAFGVTEFNSAANWDTDEDDDNDIGIGDKVWFCGDLSSGATLDFREPGASGKLIDFDGDCSTEGGTDGTLGDIRIVGLSYIELHNLTFTGEHSTYSVLNVSNSAYIYIHDNVLQYITHPTPEPDGDINAIGLGGVNYTRIIDNTFKSSANHAHISIESTSQEDGTHTGSNNVQTLSDDNASFPTEGHGLEGRTVYNTSDSSSCVITANTGSTITCSLSGGSEDDWDYNDNYIVYAKSSAYNVVRGNTFRSDGGASGDDRVDTHVMILKNSDYTLVEGNTYYESGSELGDDKSAATKVHQSDYANYWRLDLCLS
jgi:hypothetical protein